MIGSIGYTCHSGLGHLLRDFHKNGVVSKVLVVPHPHYPQHPEWYPNAYNVHQSSAFLDDLKALLIFENAWNCWHVADMAKKRGIKVCLIPNYEYSPFPPPVIPDLFICASLLDMEVYKQWPCVFIPIPVDVERYPWKLRERALTFIHNAGHGQHDYAKGTPQVIDAMKHVKAPLKLMVRGQPGEKRIQQLFHREKNNRRIEIIYDDVPDEDLYKYGDVFLNSEQYNGMSLPLQEAHASGMLVMTTNRFPANTWLPTEPLVPPCGSRRYKIAIEFDRAIIDPKDIAKTIDAWYGRDITRFSIAGQVWAHDHSWERLRPVYLKHLLG